MIKKNRKRKLSRKAGPRKMLLRVLANNLLMQEKIKTSEAKAKELRRVVEKMITKAKKADVVSRRALAKDLTPEMLKKITADLAPRYAERKGGYTRIIKFGPRISDATKMVIIELVK